MGHTAPTRLGLAHFGAVLLTILEYSKKVSLLSLQLLRVQEKVLGSTSLGRAAVLTRDRVARHRISGP